MNERLKAGATYTLHTMTVFNTGDVSANYLVQPAFNETQNERKPERSWFTFSPEKFSLDPDGAQTVTPRITIPFRAEGGDYFVYLEAVPDQTVQKGTTAIGVAAATKLYFNVEDANFFTALLNRIVSFYREYAPYSYWITGIVFLLIVLAILRRFFKLSLSVQKRNGGT